MQAEKCNERGDSPSCEIVSPSFPSGCSLYIREELSPLFAWSAVDTNPQSEPPSVVDGRTNGLDAQVRSPLHAAQAPSVPSLYGGPLWNYNVRVCVTRYWTCCPYGRERFGSLNIETWCS